MYDSGGLPFCSLCSKSLSILFLVCRASKLVHTVMKSGFDLFFRVSGEEIVNWPLVGTIHRHILKQHTRTAGINDDENNTIIR